MYIKSARFYTGKIKKRFFFRGKVVQGERNAKKSCFYLLLARNSVSYLRACISRIVKRLSKPIVFSLKPGINQIK